MATRQDRVEVKGSARAALPGPLKKSGVSKSYILSALFNHRENVRGALLGTEMQRVARIARAH